MNFNLFLNKNEITQLKKEYKIKLGPVTVVVLKFF